jgi:hypothetical protein
MKHTAAQALKFAEAAAEHKRTHKRDFFNGYPKQKEFFNLGADTRERMFMAGTQVGKSEAGSFEAACHLTGNIPTIGKASGSLVRSECGRLASHRSTFATSSSASYVANLA